MRYFKIVDGKYIIAIGTGGSLGTQIDSEEYSRIKAAISAKPEEVDGYAYRMKADLSWELVELPPAPPEPEEEPTAEDYENALGRFGV